MIKTIPGFKGPDDPSALIEQTTRVIEVFFGKSLSKEAVASFLALQNGFASREDWEQKCWRSLTMGEIILNMQQEKAEARKAGKVRHLVSPKAF